MEQSGSSWSLRLASSTAIAVAPLKLTLIPVGSSSSLLFHGFIAVAPLKSDSIPKEWSDHRASSTAHRRGPIEVRILTALIRAKAKLLFHGFIAVAPLKYACLFRDSKDSPLFHGFIAVAPLKLRCRLLPIVVEASLPRLHRRGPIEVAMFAVKPPELPPLPRLHRRGPIEVSIAP